MATTVIFSSELQKFTHEAQTQVSATNYRGLVAEIVARYGDLEEDVILEMAVAIDGEIVHDPMLETIRPGSEVHFLYRISGG
ncbi:MAG: MoaD/ThiS family protein [Proteobacteria bacterium]|jgi:molybdopterin converting factor small subunit|nr:MoaD/ThiS family protein [Pseudomonadota bacterium]MDA1299995.1 MoaD/ThiS family protein [Pseudomonadota bacterium]